MAKLSDTTGSSSTDTTDDSQSQDDRRRRGPTRTRGRSGTTDDTTGNGSSSSSGSGRPQTGRTRGSPGTTDDTTGQGSSTTNTGNGDGGSSTTTTTEVNDGLTGGRPQTGRTRGSPGTISSTTGQGRTSATGGSAGRFQHDPTGGRPRPPTSTSTSTSTQPQPGTGPTVVKHQSNEELLAEDWFDMTDEQERQAERAAEDSNAPLFVHRSDMRGRARTQAADDAVTNFVHDNTGWTGPANAAGQVTELAVGTTNIAGFITDSEGVRTTTEQEFNNPVDAEQKLQEGKEWATDNPWRAGAAVTTLGAAFVAPSAARSASRSAGRLKGSGNNKLGTHSGKTRPSESSKSFIHDTRGGGSVLDLFGSGKKSKSTKLTKEDLNTKGADPDPPHSQKVEQWRYNRQKQQDSDTGPATKSGDYDTDYVSPKTKNKAENLVEYNKPGSKNPGMDTPTTHLNQPYRSGVRAHVQREASKGRWKTQSGSQPSVSSGPVNPGSVATTRGGEFARAGTLTAGMMNRKQQAETPNVRVTGTELPGGKPAGLLGQAGQLDAAAQLDQPTTDLDTTSQSDLSRPPFALPTGDTRTNTDTGTNTITTTTTDTTTTPDTILDSPPQNPGPQTTQPLPGGRTPPPSRPPTTPPTQSPPVTPGMPGGPGRPPRRLVEPKKEKRKDRFFSSTTTTGTSRQFKEELADPLIGVEAKTDASIGGGSGIDPWL